VEGAADFEARPLVGLFLLDPQNGHLMPLAHASQSTNARAAEHGDNPAEGVYLGATRRCKSGVLFLTMRAKAVNPQNRLVDAVADAVVSAAA
jgi:hypothetical protein